ncbi:hypothetical protein ACFPM0_26530 [Pseudonocardia sulfidoxydans]|uniref:hypothetical protein n=1 Tax=Pseudonocardia sulfidoxydans TaxID=54011 RepID=UPI00361F0CB7
MTYRKANVAIAASRLLPSTRPWLRTTPSRAQQPSMRRQGTGCARRALCEDDSGQSRPCGCSGSVSGPTGR